MSRLSFKEAAQQLANRLANPAASADAIANLYQQLSYPTGTVLPSKDTSSVLGTVLFAEMQQLADSKGILGRRRMSIPLSSTATLEVERQIGMSRKASAIVDENGKNVLSLDSVISNGVYASMGQGANVYRPDGTYVHVSILDNAGRQAELHISRQDRYTSWEDAQTHESVEQVGQRREKRFFINLP